MLSYSNFVMKVLCKVTILISKQKLQVYLNWIFFNFSALFTWFITVAFLILLCLRLESRIQWSYFIIFIPVWIYDLILIIWLILELIKRHQHHRVVDSFKKYEILCCLIFRFASNIFLDNWKFEFKIWFENLKIWFNPGKLSNYLERLEVFAKNCSKQSFVGSCFKIDGLHWN